jgi:hypothetical protein
MIAGLSSIELNWSYLHSARFDRSSLERSAAPTSVVVISRSRHPLQLKRECAIVFTMNTKILGCGSDGLVMELMRLMGVSD